MPTVQEVVREITALTTVLIEQGVVDDQNMPYQQTIGSDTHVVTHGGGPGSALVLKDTPYVRTYGELAETRAYNLRMLDGALVQMHYEFNGATLSRHRLAFFPSPDLSEFQNSPELYLEDVLYADVVERRVVTVPLRFDYDGRAGVPVELDHPHSHLTLGQYSRCRIPVSAPVTPLLFVEFILRSFYNTALNAISDELPRSAMRFEQSIQPAETRIVHVGVPT